ncbi:uncharacterized protein LOC115396474 [Salarias fasciatus]|uniref:uncharacterized protein LOC115396474 n=1 Tax=Salarias fasciatus TaxID=181472 RepID=UPI0011769E8B|nr:uncharacterized protein LOC115396474 [Salarias fasciatus]
MKALLQTNIVWVIVAVLDTNFLQNNRFHFNIAGITIPSITEKPVKRLGKMFGSTLRDTASIKTTCAELDGWLKAAEQSGLPGKFKAWLYQYGILPRILWPLLVYDVPLSTVETLERKVNSHLRRWLGLPRSLSSAALYGYSNKLQLPLKSLEEEFTVTKTRAVLQYRDSVDPKVSNAGVEVKTGRKWSAEKSVQQAESRLHFTRLVGAVTRGRACFGSLPTRNVAPKGNQEQQQVQQEVRAGLEEKRGSNSLGMSKQGAWLRWESANQRRVTWADLWRAEPQRIKFLIQAVHNVLPSPANLHTWGLAESPSCAMCSKRGSLEHILSSCAKALGKGRYRCRHDQVLKSIAEAIGGGVERARRSQPIKKIMTFLKAGEKKALKTRTSTGVLTTANDWQMLVDLQKQLKFPSHIVSTSLRPDIVLFSESTKQVIMLELTDPWEDRLDETFERKLAKYEGLASSCQQAGWRLTVTIDKVEMVLEADLIKVLSLPSGLQRYCWESDHPPLQQ